MASDGTLTENLDDDMPPFWAIQYLKLPLEAREAGLRATALNFCCGPDGILKDFEKEFPVILGLLRGDFVNNVTPLRENKPTLAIVPHDDITG